MTHFIMTWIERQDFNDKMDLNQDIYKYLPNYTQYHLIRTTFIRTKYVLNLLEFKDQRMEIVSIILGQFTNYLTHKIIDFETTKLACPWMPRI